MVAATDAAHHNLLRAQAGHIDNAASDDDDRLASHPESFTRSRKATLLLVATLIGVATVGACSYTTRRLIGKQDVNRLRGETTETLQLEEKDLVEPGPSVGVGVVDAVHPPTLLCWAMALTEGVEQWLMQLQWERGTGIFGCHKHYLLSDGNLTVTSWTKAPLTAVALPGEKAWFAPVRNTPQGVWHNTNVFVRAWNWIAEEGEYLKYDWTVKVDPDCVFMPGKLQSLLRARTFDMSQPMFLLNCAQWGAIQGPLEVFSKVGAQKFFKGLKNCQLWTDWQKWGEDWFVGKCMNILGVQPQAGFETLNDMWCKVDWEGSGHTYEEEVKINGPSCGDGKSAFHPYKTTKDMKLCLQQALSMKP